MRGVALLVYVAVTVSRLTLSWLNLRHHERTGHLVPEVLRDEVDADRLRRISAYTTERARFGLWRGALSSLVTASFFFGGGLAWYDAQIAGFTSSFVGRGVAFCVGL